MHIHPQRHIIQFHFLTTLIYITIDDHDAYPSTETHYSISFSNYNDTYYYCRPWCISTETHYSISFSNSTDIYYYCWPWCISTETHYWISFSNSTDIWDCNPGIPPPFQSRNPGIEYVPIPGIIMENHNKLQASKCNIILLNSQTYSLAFTTTRTSVQSVATLQADQVMEVIYASTLGQQADDCCTLFIYVCVVVMKNSAVR